MKQIAPYACPPLSLVPLDGGNYPLLRAWRNESRTRFLDTRFISRAQHERWFESYRANDTDLCWIATQARLPVGTVSLYSVTPDSAEIGRLMVAPAYRRQGLGTRIERAALAYGFQMLHLSMITTCVRADNAPTLRLVESCGFRETTRRDGVIYFEVQP